MPTPRGYLVTTMRVAAALASLFLTAELVLVSAQSSSAVAELKSAKTGDGVVLHYAERGGGVPVVFVHGSLTDYSVWNPELAAFSTRYRAIAYSRRHNSPNTNPVRPGYSASVDADDLAAFIKALDLGPVHLVGHSYGAFGALYLATRHPELLRTLVLAEPPAVSLLRNLPAGQETAGQGMFADIQARVRQMETAWRGGDPDEGMRVFYTWNTGIATFWDSVLPEAARQGSRRNFAEWDAVLVSGELFPSISAQAIQDIATPTLIVSGSNTSPYLASIAEELARLLRPRDAKHVVIPRASHIMFMQQPAATHEAVLDFLNNAAVR